MSSRSRQQNAPTPRQPATKLRRFAAMVAAAAVVIGVAILSRNFMGTAEVVAQAPAEQDSNVQPASAETTDYKPPQHDVMAIVNGQDISRRQLEQACAERFGEDVLESMVNKQLILHHCEKQGVSITRQEIEEEVDRMAKRFKLGREQWLELLANERGINEQEYKRDILWPTIALRKLAAEELTVSPEDLQREFESSYGASVRCRIIVLADSKRATQLARQLQETPDDFARVAMNESIDVNSASIGGLIQPIRRHVGDPHLEQAAFSLQPGQVSPAIPIGNQFALLKCEGQNPPRNVTFEAVRGELAERIREGKLRDVAAEKFAEYQQAAHVTNVFNDAQLSKRMPGVVALVNGDKVTLEALQAESLMRHGEGVLSIEITHTLLEQALRSAGVSIDQKDLDAEIAHAAKLAGVVNDAGKPDVEKWIQTTTEEQGISYKTYVRDSVWPSAALKKLTADSVQITQDDLLKGYEANYGQRIRCRAIVLASMRRAQEVWEKARANPSMSYFGDLAEEYSVEPTSKALRGEVPPIRRHGGQPQLEKVAFEMTPADPPRIVQLGDKFVVLKYEGRTETKEIEFEAVKDILMQDIYEKKLRIAMGTRLEEIRANARIDNYLTGTTQSPADKKPKAQRTATAPRHDPAVRPAAMQR